MALAADINIKDSLNDQSSRTFPSAAGASSGGGGDAAPLGQQTIATGGSRASATAGGPDWVTFALVGAGAFVAWRLIQKR